MKHSTSKEQEARLPMLSQCAVTYAAAAALLYLGMTDNAHAGMCGLVGSVMGSGMAQALATVGVLMVAIGAALGRMSWTLAITVSIGIAFMFRAGSVAMQLGSPYSCFG